MHAIEQLSLPRHFANNYGLCKSKLLTNDVHVETGVVEREQVYVCHSMSEQVHLATIIYNKEAQASTG